jgi:hypothetical protein
MQNFLCGIFEIFIEKINSIIIEKDSYCSETTVGILEFTIFGPETRGFGNLRIAHVLTLKIVMSKGREFSVEF